MTLTFTPSTPQRVGPGFLVTVHIPSGPIPNDDWIRLEVDQPPAGAALTIGSARTNGSLNVMILLGITGIGGGLTGASVGLADGATVDLVARQFHANGTFVDGGLSSGWSWDPVGGLWALVGGTSSVPMALAGIQAAIQRVFPANS